MPDRVRRLSAATAVAALLVLGPGASDGDAGSSGFDGTRFTAPGATVRTATTTLRVSATYTPPEDDGLLGARVISDIHITLSGGSQPTGCEATLGEPGELESDVDGSSGVSTASRSVEASFACNGTYTAEATVTAQPGSATTTVTRTFDVLMAPAAMPAPSLSLDDRTVAISWSGLAEPHPRDFTGYRVERRAPGGSFEPVTDVGAGRTTVTDTGLPPEAGDYEYRVLALRAAPGGTVPGTGTPASISVGAGDTTTTTGDGGSAPSGSIGGGPGTAVGRSSQGAGSGASSGPPTTADDGFSDELDYSRLERGEDDDLAGAEVIYQDDDEGAVSRGLLEPMAGGMVLAMWAFHIRRLSSLARPAV